MKKDNRPFGWWWWWKSKPISCVCVREWPFCIIINIIIIIIMIIIIIIIIKHHYYHEYSFDYLNKYWVSERCFRLYRVCLSNSYSRFHYLKKNSLFFSNKKKLHCLFDSFGWKHRLFFLNIHYHMANCFSIFLFFVPRCFIKTKWNFSFFYYHDHNHISTHTHTYSASIFNDVN